MKGRPQSFESSLKLYESAKEFTTGGVHSSFRYRDPHPLYFKRAKGSKLWDVDGNEYLDFVVNMGACILGHAHPGVISAVAEQLKTGLTVGVESALSVEVAEQLTRMIPSAEVVKFSNTGTEAVMHSLQIARGHTHKQKLIKVEGCYNGWADEVLVSVHPKAEKASRTSFDPIPESAGLSERIQKSVRVIPYNDPEALERLVRKDNGGFAALIIEPIMFNSGCVLPKKGYLQEIRRITEQQGILLIFDEVITGFRIAPGGAEEYYNVKPDLAIFGKSIANGFPLSAVVGREEVMRVTDPRKGRVLYSGTYNGSQPSLAAAKATLSVLRSGDVQRRLQQKSSLLAKRFNEMAERLAVVAQMPSIGGNFQAYFNHRDIENYTSAAASNIEHYHIFAETLLRSGIFLSQFYLFHHGLSDAHSLDDIGSFLDASEKALRSVKKNSQG